MTEFDATEPESFHRRERNDLEHQIHSLVNEERRGRDLPNLDFNEHLAYIARTRSRDMGEKGYFSHTEPDGDTYIDKLEEYGYDWDLTTENIVQPHVMPNTSIPVIAERAVYALMNSSSHRKAILYPHYNLEGIGVYVTSDYTVYVTQIFDA